MVANTGVGCAVMAAEPPRAARSHGKDRAQVERVTEVVIGFALTPDGRSAARRTHTHRSNGFVH